MSKNKQDINYKEKVLEVNNLKKHFTHGVGKNKLIVPAVDGLTFDIYKREVFGLVGESGCGKTTTGRTIIKLLNPTEGTAKLNGDIIVSGYHQYIERIKEIKEEAKQKIIELDPHKSAISKIEHERDTEIAFLRTEINKVKVQRKNALEKAKKPLNDYRSNKYHAKSALDADIDKIDYDFQLDYNKVKGQTINQAEREYKRETAGAKLGFERKAEGLRESAALQDHVIENRLKELEAEYKEIYKSLDEKYEPLIKQDEKNIIPNEEAKEKIKELKQIRKDKIKKRKEEYKKEKANLKAPDKKAIRNDINRVKEEYKARIDDIKKQITDLKSEAKAKIANVPPAQEQGVSKEEIKENIQKIKEWKKEAIAEQKLKIKESKAANKSQEALEASRKMQMIFQDPIASLNPRMTVQEIVGEGLTIDGGYSKKEIKEKVGEVLELVGLSREYATRYPHEFSGGQRQRIGVARALIMDPDFIIADEPISALDVSIRAQVINLLSELKDRLGLTMLFIAHDLSVVQFFCDRIAVMYFGKIVELASSKELFKNPMHPYTKSLLSSIPQPDPDYEKNRKRIDYDPNMHDYRRDKPSLRELAPEHYIYANDEEFAKLKEEYAKQNSSEKAKVK